MFLLLVVNVCVELLIQIIEGCMDVVLILVVLFVGVGDVLENVFDIVCVDLYCSGQFKILLFKDMLSWLISKEGLFYWDFWVFNQEYVVIGIIKFIGIGVYEVGYFLYDVVCGKELLFEIYCLLELQLCDVVYVIFDCIYEQFIGIFGVFFIKIFYVIYNCGVEWFYQLQYVDVDGVRVKIILCSCELIMSLFWLLDGIKIVYVFFEQNGLFKIYVYDLGSVEWWVVVQFKGINGVLVWLLDGQKLVLMLFKGGNLDIYSFNLNNGDLEQLIDYYGIDIELCWMFDGDYVVFIFSCFGGLQIYQFNVDDKLVCWVLFEGVYNVCLEVILDGCYFVYVYWCNGSFNVGVQDF